METKSGENSPTDATKTPHDRARGGWITFPFLAGTMLGLGICLSGATSNMIVYLIKEYNVKNVDAAQIFNIVNGCTSLAPVAGAVISDAFFGCFPVVAFSTLVNFLSLILFTITAVIPSRSFPLLYLAVALLSVGTGGTRFNTMTMGADQFDNTNDTDTFFNWFLVALYVAMTVGATVVVYVQDSYGFGLGFGLCVIAGAGSLVMFWAGKRFYRQPKPKGSPFVGMTRVIIYSIRKRKGDMKGLSLPPGLTQGFRFLNRAVMITKEDTNLQKLCTVEQVEDVKTMLRVLPLWTSSMFLSISIGAQGSLTVLQALTMNRKVKNFTVPAGSINVTTQVTAAIFIPIVDRIIIPMFRKMTNRTLSPLQKLGIGHIFNTLAMVTSALVEKRRENFVHEENVSDIVPMSVLWLLLPMFMTGIGEAMHFPGLLSFFYEEFPKSLGSTATGMVALLIANGFYMSTAVVSLVRRLTEWLPNNINASRLDKVYWMLAIVGSINYVYFLVCSFLYKYKNRKFGVDQDVRSIGSV